MLNNYLNPQFQRGYGGNTMTTMPVGTPSVPQKSMVGGPWPMPTQAPSWQQPQPGHGQGAGAGPGYGVLPPWQQNAWQTPDQRRPGNMYAFSQPVQWSPWTNNGLSGYLSAFHGGWG